MCERRVLELVYELVLALIDETLNFEVALVGLAVVFGTSVSQRHIGWIIGVDRGDELNSLLVRLSGRPLEADLKRKIAPALQSPGGEGNCVCVRHSNVQNTSKIASGNFYTRM